MLEVVASGDRVASVLNKLWWLLANHGMFEMGYIIAYHVVLICTLLQI